MQKNPKSPLSKISTLSFLGEYFSIPSHKKNQQSFVFTPSHIEPTLKTSKCQCSRRFQNSHLSFCCSRRESSTKTITALFFLPLLEIAWAQFSKPTPPLSTFLIFCFTALEENSFDCSHKQITALFFPASINNRLSSIFQTKITALKEVPSFVLLLSKRIRFTVHQKKITAHFFCDAHENQMSSIFKNKYHRSWGFQRKFSRAVVFVLKSFKEDGEFQRCHLSMKTKWA